MRSRRSLGIDEVHGEVRPQNKIALVQKVAGRRATRWRWPATASMTRRRSQAPTSASPWAAGTDVAMSSAQVTLVKGDLRGIVRSAPGDVAGHRALTCSQNLGFALPLQRAWAYLS
jgi:Cu+-exporting ATPase